MHDIDWNSQLESLRSARGNDSPEVAALQACLDIMEHYNLREPVLATREGLIPSVMRGCLASASPEALVVYADRGSYTFQAHNCETELIGSILAQQLFGEDYEPTLGWATGYIPYSGLIYCQRLTSSVVSLGQLVGVSDTQWSVLEEHSKREICDSVKVDYESLAQLDVIDYILNVPERKLKDVLLYSSRNKYRTLLTGFGMGLFQTEESHPLTAYTDMSFIPEPHPLTSEESRRIAAKAMAQSIEIPAALVPEVACALLVQYRAEKLGLEMFIFDTEEGVYQ